MPIFEYKCKKCGTVFEFLARQGQKPSCPSCGGRRLEKLVSTFSAGKSRGKRAACGRRQDCGGGGCCCGGCRCGR